MLETFDISAPAFGEPSQKWPDIIFHVLYKDSGGRWKVAIYIGDHKETTKVDARKDRIRGVGGCEVTLGEVRRGRGDVRVERIQARGRRVGLSQLGAAAQRTVNRRLL